MEALKGLPEAVSIFGGRSSGGCGFTWDVRFGSPLDGSCAEGPRRYRPT